MYVSAFWPNEDKPLTSAVA